MFSPFPPESFSFLRHMVSRCDHANLKEVVSVRPSVGPFVGPVLFLKVSNRGFLNEIKNQTMSDNTQVAPYVPLGYTIVLVWLSTCTWRCFLSFFVLLVVFSTLFWTSSSRLIGPSLRFSSSFVSFLLSGFSPSETASGCDCGITVDR